MEILFILYYPGCLYVDLLKLKLFFSFTGLQVHFTYKCTFFSNPLKVNRRAAGQAVIWLMSKRIIPQMKEKRGQDQPLVLQLNTLRQSIYEQHNIRNDSREVTCAWYLVTFSVFLSTLVHLEMQLRTQGLDMAKVSPTSQSRMFPFFNSWPLSFWGRNLFCLPVSLIPLNPISLSKFKFWINFIIHVFDKRTFCVSSAPLFCVISCLLNWFLPMICVPISPWSQSVLIREGSLYFQNGQVRNSTSQCIQIH